MKKLMILVLVLGFASASNADLLLSFDGDTTVTEVDGVWPSDLFTIGVYSPVVQYGTDFWVGISGPVSYTGYGTIYSPPAIQGTVDDGGYGNGWIHYDCANVTMLAEIGTWWDLEMHCDGPGDVVINLYDSGGAYVIDTITVHQVPEPMTIALLGFGGLTLIRKRR